MNTHRFMSLAFGAAAVAVVVTPAFAQSAAQAAYEAQLRAYEQQQQDYRQARDAYDADMKRYQNGPVYVAPEYPPALYAPAAYVPFDALKRIDNEIPTNKPVHTLNGAYVGKVTNVRLTGSVVTQLEVHINPARVTWVNASHMRYDDVADVVVTDLTADQMAGRSRIDY